MEIESVVMSDRTGLLSLWTCFNIKMLTYQYRKSHCGDKMVLWPSCLHNGISYTGKTQYSYENDKKKSI